MNETPKGLRVHIAIAGRRNAGKSSLLNALAGMECAIVSPTPGTTTDPVEKTMEMSGLGPIVLVDTAGLDDIGALGDKRVERSRNILRRMDAAILVADREQWGETEKCLAAFLEDSSLPWIVVRNKLDCGSMQDAESWRHALSLPGNVPILDISVSQNLGMEELRGKLAEILEAGGEDSPLASDLVPPGGVALLVAPQDSGAPKGRLILPQAQTIRDLMDNGRSAFILTEKGYPRALTKLAGRPDLVICDSQVVKYVEKHTPANIPLTTFSILMARRKGDLNALAAGAGALKNLRPGDAVLIQEACSHHPQPDDIGRKKIPALLRQMTGGDLEILFAAGKEMADYRKDIKAIIHCGACVITRRQMCARQKLAERQGIPMTNYGMAISLAQGVLPRTLAMFPDALACFLE